MPNERTWMDASEFRNLWLNGASIEEILDRNEKKYHVRFTRSAVSRHAESLGLPPRHKYDREWLPWNVRPEYSKTRWRPMLLSADKERNGEPLTRADKNRINLLHDLISGRGAALVVGYHPEIGFYLTDRIDADEVNVPIRTPEVETRRRLGIAGLDLAADDDTLAAQAFKLGIKPNQLEGLDRPHAVTLLEGLYHGSVENADVDVSQTQIHDTARPARSRRRTG